MWNGNALGELLVKRAIYNCDIKNFIYNARSCSDWKEDIDGCFSVLFPERVYPGYREAKTMSWIMDRSTDGLGGVYPREIINLGNYAVKN